MQMSATKIERNFNHFKDRIQCCLLQKDINYFIEDLSILFSHEDKRFINDSARNEKVQNFIHTFIKLQDPSKYTILNKIAENHNKWIHTFLNVDLDNSQQCSEIKAKWIILENTLSIIKKLKDSLALNQVVIIELFQKDIISKANKDFLCCSLDNEGNEETLYQLFNVISMKDPNWYGNLLYILYKQNCNLINILFDDQEQESFDKQNCEQMCLDYAKKFISKHAESDHFLLPVAKIDDDCISDYGSYNEGEEFSDIDDLNPVEEDNPEELILKNFQKELTELATSGKNVIIYAPTGSGKTNVAVYIANDHLKKNPNGKVAFLVHRTPLVSQQYRVFKKYKNPDINVVDIRGRSDVTSGPLIFQMETNQIIVMTSDILRNALTNDDGNKISSISEFTLIFFDECHNCMKSHPYTKIMREYFKIKNSIPNSKLPQIIGLTASPRSNKKDDMPGLKKSLFELCANLDCLDFSMVKIHKNELEEFLAQPKQNIILPKNRENDEFQSVLIEQMINCERKLDKMRVEGYFITQVRIAPNNKFHQDYVGFVGNLERLNTETIDENDGKQKAFCIYRYLNAYYRGLIVNQMFDSNYAKQTIKKYLKHNGTDFTCAFDEEFYKNYKTFILKVDDVQSDNPSIISIVSHINEQFSHKEDSRILIFVREIDFTCYLVNILKSTGKYNAEAIVGSNARTDLKICSDSEIDKVLTRFHNGTTRILVATTVVEEGLDVALCNMVISYGHVTNETAMIQRKGRVRAMDSKYILILPPMLSWLEKKELLNERRKDMMMQLIKKLETFDPNDMRKSISEYQSIYFHQKTKRPLTLIDKDAWKFTCKNCQTDICTTNDVRIIENAHRICIIPELLKKLRIVKEEIKSYGSQGFYECGGRVLCHHCNNYELGSYIFHHKIHFFQVNIKFFNAIKADGKNMSFKKWADFAKFFELKSLSKDEREIYINDLIKLDSLSIQ